MPPQCADSQLYQKIKLLFSKISDPNYVLDNHYGDNLINKFSSKTDTDVDIILKSPLLSDLVVSSLDHLDTFHISVKVFITRLLAILSHNELHFGRICEKKGDYLENCFKSINSPDMKPSLKVAYMEIALAAINHCTGGRWILDKEIWTHILVLPNDKQSVFVVRQTYQFASEFLWKLETTNNETTISKVLELILKPIFTTDFLGLKSMTSEEEEQHAKVLEPMAHMMIALFNNNAERYRRKTHIVSILLHKYNLVSRLVTTHNIFHKEDLLLLFFRLTYWLVIAKVFLTKPPTENTVYDDSDLLEVSAFYFNMVHTLLKRRAVTTILDFCNACNVIWSQAWQGKGPTCEKPDGTKVEIQSQLVVLPIVPLIHYIISNQNQQNGQNSDEMVSHFVYTILESVTEHTGRAGYGMRDVINEMDHTSVMLACVKRLPFLKNHINNEQASLIFRALFFVLRSYDVLDEHGNANVEENYEDSAEKVSVMTYVMDIVLLIVKNFDIKWQESIEVLCLYTVVADLLKKPNLTTKFIVSALSVLSETVRKFQPPNLSLLMESSNQPSAINDICKLIYLRLHDMHWEVRDSTLELLLVVTEISFVKFPPFQKQILENKLVEVVATISQHDSEPYVRATALRVLGAACSVPALWDQLVEARPDIQEELISILRNNQEGIVRKEAALVLCRVHRNIKLTPTFIIHLYQHIVSAALTDFHWEVQIAALRFIKGIICRKLSEQGMLDGTFPSVTFSKEKRKIVALNEKEVQKRLIKIMEELSNIGCFTALVMLLHDDTEIEIMEHALTVSESFIRLLNEYKVPELLGSVDEEAELSEIVAKIKEDVETASDDMEEDISKSEGVIDGILNSSDINLLANIFENQLNYNEKPAPEPKLKIEKLITPGMFVHYLKSKDFKVIIEQKRQWNEGIRSLNSLLDDALGIYEVNDEVNTMDCY